MVLFVVKMCRSVVTCEYIAQRGNRESKRRISSRRSETLNFQPSNFPRRFNPTENFCNL